MGTITIKTSSKWLIGLGLLFMLGTAEAATITITTTVEQDAALVTLLKKTNAERPTPLTAAEFVAYLKTQWLDGLVAQAGQHSQTTVRDAWEKADAATRAKVKADLGL